MKLKDNKVNQRCVVLRMCERKIEIKPIIFGTKLITNTNFFVFSLFPFPTLSQVYQINSNLLPYLKL